MDRRERLDNASTALLAALQGWQMGMWTAMPAIVQSYDKAKNTITAQPAIKARVLSKAGAYSWIDIPTLLDCPVVFQGGGGFTATFPIAAGDEALMIFTSRDFSTWYQSGGFNNLPQELRMHDLSDGFALVGIRSQPRNLPGGVADDCAQLRSDDGETYVQVGPDSLVRVNAKDITVHASNEAGGACSYAWDAGGYGQRISNDGSGNITIENYTIGAVVTTNTHPYNPPEIPPP